jgi:hypothetical protein
MIKLAKHFIIMMTVLPVFLCAKNAASQTLSTNSFGNIKIGMTQAQIETALGHTVVYESQAAHANPEDSECGIIELGEGLELMMINNRLVRFTARQPSPATAEGIKVGDAQSNVEGAYKGRYHLEPHTHNYPDGNYIKIPAKNKKTGYNFEISNGVVTIIHAGQYPEVDYVEGCS